ncbi:TlpA family protein disulfide reductase [Belliella kenyensis]|uniref:TlpA family protein disulfide reductase n=2 Tax=Belliella kenyensis TaxID=1472724 RepID=A0ABV8EM71_9BACT|nr:TlpA disulfide reductase family protein [Belliella kenyensis]MCH7403901.1 TlpA family protein disulfide reductase [Belliella kenyensis]MDN3603000.1 TlpA disulfide reductase family protein [Belliella kenyensis]
MKTTTQISLILLGFFYSNLLLGQSANYYLNEEGKVLNEKDYIELKEIRLSKMKAVVKSMDIYEELDLEYNRNDSIVFSYKWHFTDNVKKTKLEIERKKALIGKEYPILNARTLDGRVISIEDLKGKPTLINLWFTSCKPCIEEMPILNKMKEEYSDKFNFLSITFESESKVRKFLQRFQFDFEHIVDSKELTRKLGFDGYPANLFLDKDGILRVIEGNVPIEKIENGEFRMSDGSKFIEILNELL